MQFDKVIEEYSIPTISARTHISIKDIEQLINRDFSGIKKVKALGFMSILEREFDLDLNDLKQECKDFFKDTNDDEFEFTLDMPTQKYNSFQKDWSFRLIVIVSIFLISLAGVWLYFTKSNANINKNQSVDDIGLVKVITSQIQGWTENNKSLSSTLDQNKDI